MDARRRRDGGVLRHGPSVTDRRSRARRLQRQLLHRRRWPSTPPRRGPRAAFEQGSTPERRREAGWSGGGCCSCGSAPFECAGLRRPAGTIVDEHRTTAGAGAESWHLTARLVFESAESDARVTTRVTYRRLPGRALWSVVGPIHRRAVPDILAAAPAPARPLTPRSPATQVAATSAGPARAKALASASSCESACRSATSSVSRPTAAARGRRTPCRPRSRRSCRDRPSASAPAEVARCSRCRAESLWPSRPSSCWTK